DRRVSQVSILQLCVENNPLGAFLWSLTLNLLGVAVMNNLEMLKNDYELKSNINKGINVICLTKTKWSDLISSRGLKYLRKELVDYEKGKEYVYE
ncbi:hypothetical protein CR513_01675, partial [Mucuna pruriens]